MKRFSITILGLLLGAAVGSAAEPGLLLNEKFGRSSGRLPVGWRADRNVWRVAGGQLWVDSLDGETRIVTGKPNWQNYEITVTATFEKVANDSRWLSVVFRSSASGATPWSHFCVRFRCHKRNGAEFGARTGPKTWRVRKIASVAEDCRLGQPRRLGMVVRGSNVEAFVDGQPVLESAFCLDRETGYVGLAASGCRARFDDFRVRRLPATPSLRKTPLKPCGVIAHRGFSVVAPENTLASIARAIQVGATGSECDVRRSKDGQIVAMHDLKVDRTTNGKGKVAELTLAELRELDAGAWKHRRYVGQRIPTLEEILAAQKDTGCTAVIEIKVEGIAQEVIEAAGKAGMMDQSAVIAFSGDVVREVRSREPRLPCAWLCGKELRGTPAERAEWIVQKAAEYKTTIMNLHYGMLSPELIAELRRRGITVWTWTVNDPVVIDALLRWGVEGITTDRPDLVLRRLAEAGLEPTGVRKPGRWP